MQRTSLLIAFLATTACDEAGDFAPAQPEGTSGKADSATPEEEENSAPALVHGWAEGSPEAERILAVANAVGPGSTVEIGDATLHRIAHYRTRYGSYESLAQLDRLWGVGARELQALWAWGEERDWHYQASPRPPVDPNAAATVFDPNACVGEPMTVEQAQALLAGSNPKDPAQALVLGKAGWATEYQACFYDSARCQLERIIDDGNNIEGVLRLQGSTSGAPWLFIDYVDVRWGRTKRQELCRVGRDCPGWTVTPHCVRFASSSFLTALSAGDRTLATQGFFFALAPTSAPSGSKTPPGTSAPELPLEDDFDPLSCDGPILDEAVLSTRLGDSDRKSIASGTVLQRTARCYKDGRCDAPDVVEATAASLELLRGHDDDVFVMMRTERPLVGNGAAICPVGDERCQSNSPWYAEVREGCARFKAHAGAVMLGRDSGIVTDWVVRFELDSP